VWFKNILLTTSCFALQTGAILIPFFQQFSGINTIMFYATELFDVLGDGANSALLDTAIVGAVNVGSTILAIVLVDRYAVPSAHSSLSAQCVSELLTAPCHCI